MKYRLMLFGDEAWRNDGKNLVFTYSTVGGDARIIDGINERVWQLKREFCPSLHPRLWKIHMKVLTSGQHRNASKVFRDWDRSKTEEFFRCVDSLFRSSDALWVFNISKVLPIHGLPEREIKRNARIDAYSALLLYTIDTLTSAHCQPVFKFDDDQETDGARERRWASDFLIRGQHSLLYAYLAKGIEIPPPVFVQPGSEPCLELADYVSYSVARYYWKRWRQEEPDFDPVRLGSIFYLGFDSRNELIHLRDSGYPWEKFYG